MILQGLLKSCRQSTRSCFKFSHGGYGTRDTPFLVGKLNTAGGFYITCKWFLLFAFKQRWAKQLGYLDGFCSGIHRQVARHSFSGAL